MARIPAERIMRLFQLQTTQVIDCNVHEAWTFFSNPRNLSAITPPGLNLRPVSELPTDMHEGLIIVYRVRPVLHIPIKWVTEITHVREKHFFVDEQRFGPYRFWHHEHRFDEVPGGVQMFDRVTYALPFDPCSRLIHRWIVAPQLKSLFEYRRIAVERLFSGSAGDLKFNCP
jgi:ligand-binding SRPBCC domain-containing protein